MKVSELIEQLRAQDLFDLCDVVIGADSYGDMEATRAVRSQVSGGDAAVVLVSRDLGRVFDELRGAGL